MIKMLFQAGFVDIFINMIPPSIILILTIFFCTFFSKNYFKTKYKMFGYLSLFYLTYILSVITMIMSFFFWKI